MINQTQVDQFTRDGVIKLEAAFDLPWIEKLRDGVAQNFAEPSEFACQYTPEGEPGGFYDDYCNWARIDGYREFLEASPAAEIAGRLMGSDAARIYHEHVLVKEAGTREISPWHQDLPYYGVEGEKLCSIWLPLDNVPLEACPEFVKGSHQSGERYIPKKFVSHKAYGDKQSGYADTPDIEADRSAYNIVSWDMQLGDCIVFHMATLHGAPGTAELKSRRRAFSTRWLGDDARFFTRPWETSPPFPELQLEEGQAMNVPSFPMLWQR